MMSTNATRSFSLGAVAIVASLGAAAAARAQIPDLPYISDALPTGVREPLEARRARLDAQRRAVLASGGRHNARCNAVNEASPAYGECLASRARVNGEIGALRAATDALQSEVTAAGVADRKRIVAGMNALAKRLGWSAEEQARLAAALDSLSSDGDPDVTGAQIATTWNDVLARGQDANFAREADGGDGPGFPGAGVQSFEDCTIFALANAAGQPYGVVAALATDLISKGAWRGAAAHTNLQRAIERRGLSGGEVVMLAEALGQAEVVRSENFAATLRGGRRVLVALVPENGDVLRGHEVLLTKTFQHGGETWFVMMDSNQGPQQRLYLSARELDVMLKESGVAYRPEPGRTPQLLR